MKIILFDLEADNLLDDVTKVHCAVTIDVANGELREFGPLEIEAFLAYIDDADLLYAHNGLRYDFPVLEKLYDYSVPVQKRRDTMVLARLVFPDVRTSDADINAVRLARGEPGMGEAYGSHSIEAWGIRLGEPKLHADITDWSVWTPQMQERCVSDTKVLYKLLKHINPDSFSQDAVVLEHRVALVCEKITEAGWPFDLQAAGKLHADLANEKHRLEQLLAKEFSGWVDIEVFVPKRNNKTQGYKAGVPFEKRIPVTFNPNSRHHIARALKERGWVPSEFTDGGQPKLDEEIIESIAASVPAAADIATYLMIGKRLGQLADGDNALLKSVQDDLRIHGAYNPMGAVTSRASHFKPNIAQVPNSSSPYGKEFRALFVVPKGWECVGADMEGLEIRALCHYLTPIDGGEFTKLTLEGDVHWANTQAMGLVAETEARDKHNDLHTIAREIGAKRFFYAWLYGAGAEKAGRILLDVCRAALKANPDWGHLLVHFFKGNTAPSKKILGTEGNFLKKRFLQKVPALGHLIAKIAAKAEKFGGIPGLDGRRIPVRSAHAALNTLLQSCGAILCKRWLCDFHDAALADGLRYGWDGDFVILGWIHDEIQVACRNGLGDRIGRLLTSTAQTAGHPYGFRVRLDSNYKIGSTWADTH